MESMKPFTPKRTKFSLFKSLISSNFNNKETDNDTNSSASKKSQCDSITTDDKTEDKEIKNSVSQICIKKKKLFINEFSSKINLNKKENKNSNVDNIDNSKNININNSINNSTKKKSNSKLLIFKENKSPEINNKNKKRKLLHKDIFYSKITDDIFRENKYNFASSPPPTNCLHYYNYLTNSCINENKEIYRTKIPHVFINHLVVKNRLNFNINKKSNYLSLLVSKRIKEKNLTILYYRPSKDL